MDVIASADFRAPTRMVTRMHSRAKSVARRGRSATRDGWIQYL